MVKIRKFFLRDKNQKMRTDIQFLRCIAVISVVVFHISAKFLPGGFMGVDVFFVISGFLMTKSIWGGVKDLTDFSGHSELSDYSENYVEEKFAAISSEATPKTSQQNSVISSVNNSAENSNTSSDNPSNASKTIHQSTTQINIQSNQQENKQDSLTDTSQDKSHLNKNADPKLNFLEGLKFLVTFYARRIKRLAPAASVLLLLIIFTLYLFDNTDLISETVPQIIASSLFYQNLFLLNLKSDYFGADQGDSCVNHFWSLSVEEQFYMIWPLLLLIIGVIGFVIFRKKIKSTVLAFIILFTSASFIYSVLLTQSNITEAYFNTFSRIYELSAGGIIVLLLKPRINEIVRNIIVYLSTLIILLFFIFSNNENFPGIKAIIIVVLTMIIIYFGTANVYHGKVVGEGNEKEADKNSKKRFDFSLNNLMRFRPIQYFGDISYSLYLYHMPLIIFVPIALDLYLPEAVSLYKYRNYIILFLSIIFASLSYVLIEKPFKGIFNIKKK